MYLAIWGMKVIFLQFIKFDFFLIIANYNKSLIPSTFTIHLQWNLLDIFSADAFIFP